MSELFLFCNTLLLILCIGIFSFIASRYKRCPSNKVIVVYGKVGGGACCRCVHGGGVFIWPLIQHYAVLSLEPMDLELDLKDIFSRDNKKVSIQIVLILAVSTDSELLQKAAVRLLGLDKEQILSIISDTVKIKLKKLINSLLSEELKNQDNVSNLINTQLRNEFYDLGLKIIKINQEINIDKEKE